MEKSNFVVHAYGLKELAIMYFPNNTPQSAANMLKKWMNKKELMNKLEKSGYNQGQKILTPVQVAIIVEHIGEP